LTYENRVFRRGVPFCEKGTHLPALHRGLFRAPVRAHRSIDASAASSSRWPP